MQYIYKLLLVLLIPGFLQGQAYKSDFGFNSKTSDNWVIVTKEEVSKNPDLFNFTHDAIQKMDPSLISQIKKMALSGKIEILYYKKSDKDFNDNVNLIVAQRTGSAVTQYKDEVCRGISDELKKAYNRSTKTHVYYCDATKVHGIDTINYKIDGAILGTKSYGYYFNTKENIIVLTLTCKDNKCQEVKKETELIFKNMKLN